MQLGLGANFKKKYLRPGCLMLIPNELEINGFENWLIKISSPLASLTNAVFFSTATPEKLIQ